MVHLIPVQILFQHDAEKTRTILTLVSHLNGKSIKSTAFFVFKHNSYTDLWINTKTEKKIGMNSPFPNVCHSVSHSLLYSLAFIK